MTERAFHYQSAVAISNAVKGGEISASALLEQFLQRIEQLNPELNAYTQVISERARKRALTVDKTLADKGNPGPLCGVPFAVKNLFDIEGLVTLAGSKINADNAPATADALLIKRLENAGAICVGALNMGEYAYDFTGENAHHGNCHNPWQLGTMSGGSSSGSGSATAAGIAPLSLGSDTNGSIRVPASLCGLFGLKPSYGRLPRSGSFPFCDSLDHLGPLARSSADLAVAFDALQGFDSSDHACVDKPAIDTSSQLALGSNGLRIAKLDGYFATDNFPVAGLAVNKVCKRLDINSSIELPGAEAGRAAAYLITNIEGANLHLDRIRRRPEDFDPDTRDRFLAGTLLPASWYVRAQQVRHWYRQQVNELFKEVDILVAPATPCTAPTMGDKVLMINGQAQPLRPNLGYFTQPISAIGLPSCVVPTIDDESGMPIGVQIIAAPWREDLCLRVAAELEAAGLVAHIPGGIDC